MTTRLWRIIWMNGWGEDSSVEIEYEYEYRFAEYEYDVGKGAETFPPLAL